jgi:hypothetical protein
MTTFMDRWLCTRYRDLDRRGPAFDNITAHLETLGRDVIIVETGCLREEGNWGGDGQSTLVWDAFVNYQGGQVFSVDLDVKAAALANSLTSDKTRVEANDSLAYLLHLATLGLSVDLLYLDSYDIDWSQPEPSMQHHVKELDAAWPMLKPGTVVAVDDNLPKVGKGYLVAQVAKREGWTVLAEGYVLAWIVT